MEKVKKGMKKKRKQKKRNKPEAAGSTYTPTYWTTT
jgi:hypothetical protein